jgi:GT2 family glycosyltransferase
MAGKSGITVIIVTFRREQSLLRLLGALAKQTDRDFGVVVVEQAERHEHAYAEACRGYGIPFAYAFLDHANTPAARNRGVALADSPIVLFLDDDSLPDPGWLAAMRRRMEADPALAGVVGRVITPGQSPEPGRRDTGRVRWDGSVSDGFSSTVPQTGITAVIGCNMGFRRTVIYDIGGFDTRFTGNAMREETDLSLRLTRADMRVAFEPAAVVTHLREASGGARKSDDRLYWYYHYLSNETYFFLKHISPLLLPVFALRMAGPSLRCMFGFGREVSFRSLALPARAIADGIRKYHEYRTHHRT